MNVFFIAGQPRTRTAWLANFLTYKDSYCFHEALKRCPTPQDMRALFEAVHNSTDVRFVGDSDSGIPFLMDELVDEFPEAKLVVIERNVKDVIESFKRAFPLDDATAALAVEKTQLALERLKKNHAPLVIGFEELASEETVRQLWSHCLPQVTFDLERWKMLDGFKVEVIAQKYLDDFTHRRRRSASPISSGTIARTNTRASFPRGRREAARLDQAALGGRRGD